MLESLLEVFKYVDITERVAFERVNRAVKDIVDSIWRAQHVLQIGFGHEPSFVCPCRDVTHTVRAVIDTFKLPYASRSKRPDVAALVRRCENLKALYWDANLCDDFATLINDHCPHLEHLYLDTADEQLLALDFRRLKCLNIGRLSSKIEWTRKVVPMIAAAEQLVCLEMFHSTPVLDAISRKAQLEKLVINTGDSSELFGAADCEILTEFVNLKSLVIRQETHNPHDELMPIVLQYSRLEELDINVRNSSAREDFKQFIRSRGPYLKSLKIEGIDREELDLVIERAPNLRRLSVTSVRGQYNRIYKLSKLRELELQYLACLKQRSLAKEEVHQLLHSCVRLRSIKLPGCNYYDSEGHFSTYIAYYFLPMLISFAERNPLRTIHAELGLDQHEYTIPPNLRIRQRCDDHF